MNTSTTPPTPPTTGSPVWSPARPPRVGVSSCLLGERVRYNGGHKKDRFLGDVLGHHVDWAPVCPEVEIGLGTPRETLRVTHDGTKPRLIAASGADHTGAMESFALRRIAKLEQRGLCGYVLKSTSPSCGLGSVPVHTEEASADTRGSGLYAAMLTEAAPLLAIEEEGRLNDPGLREHFIERVFAHARLMDLLGPPWKHADLVTFHGRHTLQLMAHSPELANQAGRIVAAGERGASDVRTDYRHVFLRALAIRPSRDRHVQALRHALDQIGDRVDDNRHRTILAAITSYRDGHTPLHAPIALLAGDAHAAVSPSMRVQTYFEPFPPALEPHQHV